MTHGEFAQGFGPDAMLTEEAYEPIRAALFDCPPGQSATGAKRAIAAAIRANPLPLFLWLTDARIVEHVQFVTEDDRRVRMSIKDAPPFTATHFGGTDG